MDTVTIPHAPAPKVIPEVTDNRLWLASPAYGSKVDSGWMTSVMSCFSQLQCVGDLQIWGGDSLVCRARNNLCSMFLDGRVLQVQSVDKHNRPLYDEKRMPVIEEKRVKFDWMLFIDTDLIFQPHEVQMLYDLAIRKGPGIYCGTYPLKTIKPKIVFNPRPGSSVDAEGVVSVFEGGTGFMMIHRSCLEKMRKAYPDNDYTRDGGDQTSLGPGHDWFQVGTYKQENKPTRYLSEDYYFCRKWIDMGGDIYMQTKICANHIGMITYPINPQEIIAVAEVYTKALANKQEKAEKAKEIADAHKE